jgi:kexin
LTWRDIQHLCIETARIVNPDDPDWEPTHQGRPYSYKYGYGALDAFAYVTAAQKWNLVKPQAWFQTPTIQIANGTMNKDGDMDGGEKIGPGGVRNTMLITQDMLEENNFEGLEHINVQVWISHTRRGDVEVEVVSPNGIRSILGGMRKSDRADSGYPGWLFMSVKHW